jgi:hypothetical protein
MKNKIFNIIEGQPRQARRRNNEITAEEIESEIQNRK